MGLGALSLGCGEPTVEMPSPMGPGIGSATDGPMGADDGDDGESTSGGGSVDDDGSEDDAGLFDVPPPDDVGEPCDGFDNNGNGQVDELCACEPGSTQSCFAGLPEDLIECRATTQDCETLGGSESVSNWGACAGLCDASTLMLDDPAVFRVLGAQAGDEFSLVDRAGSGDINGDGELDLLGAAVRGDGVSPDAGVAYGIYGGPCLQGSTLDLATNPLDGSLDAELQGGVVFDNATAFEGQSSPPVTNAMLADANGDGLADIVATLNSHSVGVGFGSMAPTGLIDANAPDGVLAAALTGGGGNWAARWGLGATDYDGDGYDDAFMPSLNAWTTCPCNPTDGISVWWGREAWEATQGRDAVVQIGLGTVGLASQTHHSVVGGAGDFDNDGFLDITAGHGAANDGQQLPYRAFAFFGGPDRALPSSMVAVDGTSGFYLGGGPGRGPQPNHQYGDFDGDGIDDLLAYALNGGARVYLVYGRPGPFPATLDANTLGTDGLIIEHQGAEDMPSFNPGQHLGFGDIDGDGYDDIVLPSSAGGVLIVWGRAGTTGELPIAADSDITVIEGNEELPSVGRIAVEDVDGDGLGDLVVGLPQASTDNGAGSGMGIVKFGSCLAELHNPGLVRGYDGSDQLEGGVAGDSIAAGRGDDLVLGGGGPDVLYGGAGDDTLVVSSADFVRADGGAGRDTLTLEGAMQLDLRTLGRRALTHIEAIELGDGAQTLSMHQGEVSSASPTSNRLDIDGDAADTVQLAGPWTLGPTVDGRVEYHHGALVVAVDTDVTVVLLPQ